MKLGNTVAFIIKILTLGQGKKIANYSGTIQKIPYQVKNLTWYATCTADIKNIHYTNPAPAIQNKSKDG